MKEWKIKLEYILIILVALRTWCSISIIFESTEILESILNVFIILIFSVIYISKKHRIKDVRKDIILMALFLYTSYITKSQILLFIPIIIIGTRKIDIKKAIKLVFYINIFILAIHIIYFFICILLDTNRVVYFVDEKGKRFNLFLRHPNYASAMILWLLAMYIYIKEKYSKIILNISICLIMIFTYIITKSRTSLLGFAYLLFVVTFSDKKSVNTVIKQITKFAFPCISIILIFLLMNYEKIGSIVYIIDKFLSGRIKLTYIVFSKYNYTLLGQYIDFSSSILIPTKYYLDKVLIDSFVYACFLNYGIIYIIAISIAIYKYCNKSEKNIEILMVLLLIIVTITEKYIIFPTIAFPTWLIGRSLYQEKKKISNEDEEEFKKV